MVVSQVKEIWLKVYFSLKENDFEVYFYFEVTIKFWYCFIVQNYK